MCSESGRATGGHLQKQVYIDLLERDSPTLIVLGLGIGREGDITDAQSARLTQLSCYEWRAPGSSRLVDSVLRRFDAPVSCCVSLVRRGG